MRVLVGLVGAIVVALASPAAAHEIVGKATVVDGDTLEISGQRVRLHGIDAPEGQQDCTRAGKPYRCGDESAQALRKLVAGKDVHCAVKDRDQYDRLVAVCVSDGIDINERMVRQGAALAYRRYSTAYVRAEEEARRERIGIWSSEFERPDEWRRAQRMTAAQVQSPALGSCAIKGNINSKGRHIYHTPGQEDYDKTVINTAAGERWFCSVVEAESAGWTRASR